MILKQKIKSHSDIEAEYKNGTAYFGLPNDVKFCKKCIISNQRPNSEIEFKHTNRTQKKTIQFDKDGICDACRVAEQKSATIDWKEREQELIELCDKYRSNNSYYDCIVPGSGGKDSFYTSHILKYKYGMNPLTITWAPHMYTEWGIKNMENWTNSGFDNYLITPNRKVQRLLTRLSLENLFHPFQPFQFGQKFLAPRLASKMNIKLIFYGENQAEYGNSIKDLSSPTMNPSFFSSDRINEDEIFIGGVSVTDLKSNFELTDKDLMNYMPLKSNIIRDNEIEVHFLSHYLKWHNQSNYYYAVKHGGFVTSPERMPGTYSKYSSIDDKMEDFNYYTLGIKYGLGWTSYVASFEIRDGDLTREEGVLLAKKYDLEFPSRFENDLYKYISINPDEYSKVSENFQQPIVDKEYFMSLHDKFRSPHLWTKDKNNNWQLRHTVWQDREKNNFMNINKEDDIKLWEGNKRKE
tara:strand:- start:1757 stop:3151 length:1395 start_codon:yes stop_codon:yes gene_type:complete